MLVHIHMHKVFGFLRQGFFHIAWASPVPTVIILPLSLEFS